MLFSKCWQRQFLNSVRSLTSCSPRYFRGAYVGITPVLLQRVYSALADDRFPAEGPVVYHLQHYGWSVHLFFGKKLNEKYLCTKPIFIYLYAKNTYI